MIILSGAGQQYTLRDGDNTIGRSSECSLCLSTERVSRRHAVIRWDGQQAVITDLGSTNGTRLNGVRLEANRSYPLRAGDRLEIGGPENSFDVGLSSMALPQPEPIANLAAGGTYAQDNPPPVEIRRGLPTWIPVAIIAAVVVLLIAGGALLLSRRSNPPAAAPVAAATGLPAAAAATQPAAATPRPSSTPVQAVKVAESANLPAAGLPTVSLPAGGLDTSAASGITAPGGAPGGIPGAGQAPAINPSSMPDLVGSLVKDFTNGVDLNPVTTALPSMLGGTAMPDVQGVLSNLTGGTPMPGLNPNPAAPALPGMAQRRSAPVQRAPASGSSFRGGDAGVILEWEAVPGLAENEYYRVMLYYKQGGQETGGGTWLKSTSYRVPAWFLDQQEGRFDWQVVVVEASAAPEQNGKLGQTVSPPSERRWFNWGR